MADPALRALVAAAEEAGATDPDAHLHVLLLIGGTAVSGRLVDSGTCLAALAQEAKRKSPAAAATIKHVSSGLEPETRIIYLVDVAFSVGNSLIKVGGMALDIDYVAGWTLGQFADKGKAKKGTGSGG